MPARRKRGRRVIEMMTMKTEPINCQALTARPTPPAAEPAMPTICSVEMLAATIEMPMSGQVRLRPPRKKSEEFSETPTARRLFQTERPMTTTKKRTKETIERVCTG